MAFGNLLHPFQLPGKNRRGSDVAGFAALDDIVQGLHDFFHRRIGIQAVDLIDINVVQAQPFQAVVDFRHDILAGQAAAVGPARTHFKIDFRRHDDFIAVQTKIADIPAGDFLTGPHLIDIGRIEIIDAQFNGPLENGLAVFIIFRPREDAVFLSRFTETHHTQANAGHVHPCIAKFYIFHLFVLLILSVS